jgi:predicted ferric reductase
MNFKSRRLSIRDHVQSSRSAWSVFESFSFQPGDYVSINLPRVALYEFHPFTISSAPEETDALHVHIQAVGNWTKQVYQRFKEMSESDARENHVKVYRADLHPEQSAADLQATHNDDCADNDDEQNSYRTRSRKREPVVINGPYSSCARYIFDCKHVVLIGGGIGITPYASILSSLMAQFRASRVICKHCNGINYNSKGLVENRRLKKVDFIWVNRDQKNFEWFLNLLRQFEQEQEYYLASNSSEKRFLDIHLYFTEIKHDENIGNVPLDLVTKIWAEVAGQDIFTSLKSKTHIGRPKWEDLFGSLISGENASTANDVNVFFCGPSGMARTIRNHCATYRFRFYEEKF